MQEMELEKNGKFDEKIDYVFEKQKDFTKIEKRSISCEKKLLNFLKRNDRQ